MSGDEFKFIEVPGTLFSYGKYSHTHRATLLIKDYFELQAEIQCDSDIRTAFNSLLNNEKGLVVTPLFNNTDNKAIAGTIENLRQFGRRLKPIGKFRMRIENNLFSDLPSTKGITRTYTHPQIFLQCEEWLKKNLSKAQQIVIWPGPPVTAMKFSEWKLSPQKISGTEAYTSGSCARYVIEEGLKNVGVIGTRDMGKDFGLNMVAEGIETNKSNATDFLLIASSTFKVDCEESLHLFFVRSLSGDQRNVLHAIKKGLYSYPTILINILAPLPTAETLSVGAYNYLLEIDTAGQIIFSAEIGEALIGIDEVIVDCECLGTYGLLLSEGE